MCDRLYPHIYETESVIRAMEPIFEVRNERRIIQLHTFLASSFLSDSIDKLREAVITCKSHLRQLFKFDSYHMFAMLHALLDLSEFIDYEEGEKERLERYHVVAMFCGRGLPNFVSIAVKRGANVNHPNLAAIRAIEILVDERKSAHLSMVQSLLRGGLDVHPNTKSYSPYMATALGTHQYGIVDLLHRYDLARVLLSARFSKDSLFNTLPREIIPSIVEMAGNGIFNVMRYTYSNYCDLGTRELIWAIHTDYINHGASVGVEELSGDSEEDSSEEEEE